MTNTNMVSEVLTKTMARFHPSPKFSYKADEWEEWLADFDEFPITCCIPWVPKRPEKYIIHSSMGKYADGGGTEEVDGRNNDYSTVVRKVN